MSDYSKKDLSTEYNRMMLKVYYIRIIIDNP